MSMEKEALEIYLKELIKLKSKAEVKLEKEILKHNSKLNKIIEEYPTIYGSIKDNKLEVEDFIKQHNHIQYCEAILYPDGTISYVKPSHTETLIRATGMTHKEVYEEMPITAHSLYWLLDKTRCIAIYYNDYIEPLNKKITLAQKIALKKLAESDIVSFKY